jgi:ribose/xylose/arabinose/galactoside ABC-type transport system permease subunit
MSYRSLASSIEEEKSGSKMVLDTVRLKMMINTVLIVAAAATFTAINSSFLSGDNAINLFRQSATVIIVGVFVTVLMISRNFDLSVGGVMALTGCVAAVMITNGLPLWVGYLIALAVGAGVGLTNALLVNLFGINAFIATLATLYLAAGGASLITGDIAVTDLPRSFKWIGGGFVGPFPTPVVIMAIAIVVAYVLLEFTTLGVDAKASGSNPIAATLLGLRPRRTSTILFVICGVAAALGGIITASRVGAGDPALGKGFEFQVITAAVLGGVRLSGGQGSVLGTVVGALLISSLSNGLDLSGVTSFWQNLVIGAVLIAAVATDPLIARVVTSRAARLDVRHVPRPANGLATS